MRGVEESEEANAVEEEKECSNGEGRDRHRGRRRCRCSRRLLRQPDGRRQDDPRPSTPWGATGTEDIVVRRPPARYPQEEWRRGEDNDEILNAN